MVRAQVEGAQKMFKAGYDRGYAAGFDAACAQARQMIDGAVKAHYAEGGTARRDRHEAIPVLTQAEDSPCSSS